MRLIIEYTVSDSYTCWCTITVPVVSESAEAFIVEFEKNFHQSDGKYVGTGSFTISGQLFQADDFVQDGYYTPPEIYTVDEWFEYVEKEK
jgi:hypothetical protein